MKSIFFFYQKIIHIGVDVETDTNIAKQTKLVNIYTITWIHLEGLYMIEDFINRPLISSNNIMHLVGVLVMLIILLFTYKKHYLVSKLCWLIYAIFGLSFWSVYTDPGHFIEYFLLLFPASSISFFKKNIIGYISFPITFIMFLIPYYFIPVYPTYVINNLDLGVVVGVMTCIFLLVLYFKTMNSKNEALLMLEKDKVLSDKIILENQQRKLKELSAFKSHFFVNISHEIRTPLTLIKGYSNKLSGKPSDLSSIAVIKTQIKQLNQIVNDILDLSKLEENKLKITKTQLNITTLLQKVYTDFKPLFEEKNIEFNFESIETALFINADKELLLRALHNLLTNALKFTPEKGMVKIVLQVSSSVLVSIIDTGIGIPEENLDMIFNRFFQSRNHITKSMGSGIGLSITKSILDAHEYTINVTSKVGSGTTFEINILEHDFKYNVPEHITKQIENKKNIDTTILLVDDNEEILNYLTLILKEDYRLIKAKNGKQALQILKKGKIDLLLTDFMMPIMDGFDLIKELQKQNIQIPTLVLTARQDVESKINMLRLGVDAYIKKPFEEQELKILIHNCLKNEDNRQVFIAKTNVKEDVTSDVQLELLTKAKMFINEYLDDNSFSVGMLADLLFVSERTLHRRIKAITGISPKEMIQEYRFQKALEFYKQNKYHNISQLSQAVGYKNAAYFAKKMKEVYAIELVFD